MFNHIDEAILWIQTQTKFRPKTSLEHVKTCYEMLNLDISKIKKIHVTGTNGKGSVSMSTSYILIESGLRVGTFTSPYLISFNERIKLNGENISNEDLLIYINKIYNLNEEYFNKTSERLSFFELITLTAILYFNDMSVDVMIMEVGIGGLLDSTNILNYDLSLITNIGFDHQKTLGNTLEEIAYNKLGIVKENNHLITTVDKELQSYFIDNVNQKNATVKFLGFNDLKSINDYPNEIEYKGKKYKLSLLGKYQQLNALLSIEAINYLFPEIKYETIYQGLLKTKHPGRLETVLDGVIIDGAHNIHAIEAIIFSLQTTFKMYNISVLFSALADKESKLMLEMLEKHVQSITLTSFPDPRYESLEKLPYPFELDPLKALKNLIENRKENDLIIITGSLHFIGYVKGSIIPYL